MVGGKESLDMIDRRALQVTPSSTIVIPNADSISLQVEMVRRSQATRWWLCGLCGGRRRCSVRMVSLRGRGQSLTSTAAHTAPWC